MNMIMPRGVGNHKWTGGIFYALETKRSVIFEKTSSGWVYVIEPSSMHPTFEYLSLIGKFPKTFASAQRERQCFIGKIYKLNGLVHDPTYYNWMEWNDRNTFDYISNNNIKPIYVNIYLMINTDQTKIYKCV